MLCFNQDCVKYYLSITRIDGGKIKIAKTPVVLDELIDSVMTKFLAQFPNQNVILDIPNEIVVSLDLGLFQ